MAININTNFDPRTDPERFGIGWCEFQINKVHIWRSRIWKEDYELLMTNHKLFINSKLKDEGKDWSKSNAENTVLKVVLDEELSNEMTISYSNGLVGKQELMRFI